MENNYEMRVRKSIEDIVPGLSQDISKITVLNSKQSQLVLGSLLSFACQSQNELPIRLARSYLKQISPQWLELALPLSIDNSVNLGDEWDYRRLLELLREVCPKLISRYVEIGRLSSNNEVKEAANNFKEII